MGLRWRAWWRSGERGRQEQGPGELWRRLGERKQCEWGLGADEARWRRGERESPGREFRAGGEQERCGLWERDPLGARLATPKVSVAPGGPHALLTGTGAGGGGLSPASMDLPLRGVVLGEVGAAAVVASGTDPVCVWGVVLVWGRLWGGWAPSAWTWWPKGYGSW